MHDKREFIARNEGAVCEKFNKLENQNKPQGEEREVQNIPEIDEWG